ncbi:translocation/assembly module TamB domain-containing protein [Marinobacter daepoensis]|uniref:translocation/assembly module TamB domain-containing protein n=1 Tax=Marinobacter daepoensis TaxID=262077 RepID=UPI00040E8036|nr:translocation/assembly module TamB domain-containing protein [Marinobacter daepoensis]
MTDEHRQENPAPEARRRRHRPWWFWPLIIVLVVVLVPLVLLLAALLVLRSETGTAWVIDQIPGLQTHDAQGSMLGAWQADELSWQGYGVRVRVEKPELDWSPGCLLELTVCLDTLKADSVAVVVQNADGGEDAPRTDIHLPTFSLPLAVRIRNVQLGQLSVNDETVWNRLELQARLSGATVDLEEVLFQRDDIVISAKGRTVMRGDWPLNLTVNAKLPPPGGDEWRIGLDLSGSVRELRVSGTSSGYLTALFEGRAEPLSADLPARLTLTSDAFRPDETLPETLMLKDWRLELAGSLAGGFRARTEATVPATTGPVSASVEGLLTPKGASGVALSMVSPGQEGVPEGRFEANGSVVWAGDITAEAQLMMDRFPWYGLLPELDRPPVDLNRLEGELQYQAHEYQAELEASVTGPLGEAELWTSLEGDLASVTVRHLDVSTGAGSLSGDGELGFAGPLAWNARLELDQFNPGYWLPMLEGSLNGQVVTEGQMRPSGLPELSANVDLSGQWRQQKVVAKGELTTEDEHWALTDFSVRVGENTVGGEGRYGETLLADLFLDLSRPEQLMNGLAGVAKGRVRLSGSPGAPEGSSSLSVDNFAWQDKVRVRKGQLQARLGPSGTVALELDGNELSLAGQKLDRVQATLDGDQARHVLRVEADHPEASVLLEFAGGLGEQWQEWRGEISRGEIVVMEPGQTWRLDSKADLNYIDSTLSLGRHCWLWQESSVCAEDQRLWPAPRLAYEVRGFPAAAFSPAFPETVQWQSSIDADIALELTDAGPNGRLRVDAGAGAFRFLVLDEWESIQHDHLVLEATLKPEVADIGVDFSGPELGTLNLDLAVDPLSPDRPIEGAFSLEDLNLAFLSAFTGIEDVQGQVNGKGALSGPLLRPEVTGELVLTDGRVFDPGLPLPLEDLLVVLEFRGQAADVSGRWHSNDRSQGEVSGSLEWAQTPNLMINLKGDRLPVTLEPFARLEVGPDLDISFREGELSVAGQVNVPRGEIEVQNVPPSAVSVSEDEVIVGVEREEPAIRSMLMDVTVVVGEDRVSFDAFGVTGDLEGTLRVGNNMDTRGTLQLVDGRYEAFGQELELRKARILFVGALTSPYLDIEAIREVDTVVAGIRLTGPAEAPETEVFSEPAMPQSEALSYVILGRAPRGQGDDGQMSQAALSLGLTQASKITQGIGNELGIRNLTLEAEGSGDQASVVASGYITEDLSLRYGVGIFEPITTVALRYDLGRYFYLEAASGLAASLDIFYTRNF